MEVIEEETKQFNLKNKTKTQVWNQAGLHFFLLPRIPCWYFLIKEIIKQT